MTARAEGSATIWALIAVLVIWAAAAVGSLEVLAVQVRHRADAAADAAALAAAGEGGLDPVRACSEARAAAERVGAHLVSCAMAGPYATVAVRVSPPAELRWAGAVTARARAGPADTAKPELSAITRTPT